MTKTARGAVLTTALLGAAVAILSPQGSAFLAATQAASPQDSGPPPPTQRRRLPVELSEVITHSPLVSCAAAGDAPAGDRMPLRLATWNIRAARSAAVGEIAAELRSMRADVAALQEVDVLTRRAGSVDQPLALSAALNFHYAFVASIRWDGGDYGLAVLSRWPLVDVRRHRIVSPAPGEPRIVLEATLCVGGRPLRLFNHHADVRAESRQDGFAQLADLVRPILGQGVVVLGDFNERPTTPGLLALVDTGLVDLGAQAGPTTSDGRLDYLLVDSPVSRLASGAQVWRTTRSDHHAVVTEFAW